MTSAPKRYASSVIPHIFVDGASEAIAYYEKAFGARELFRVAKPDGTVVHAEISIAGSVFMMGDPDGVFGAPDGEARIPVGLHIYVSDVDRLHADAVAEGAVSISEPTDMFYGDRMAMLRDPYGHVWVLLEHREDLTPAEIKAAGEALLAQA